MEIIYRDDAVVVCIKERGLLSQASSQGEKSMISLLEQMTGSQVYPVHRLDKEVGGVMVYALNSESAAELSRQVSDRTMEKTYITVVHGAPDEKEGVLEDLLFFDKSRNKAFTVKKERRGVKKALLDYRVLKSDGEKTKLKVRLHTGRTHQIRVQLASRRMPIYGDRRYGGRDDSSIIALWSCCITFVHPVTKERLTFERESSEDIFNF